MLRWWMSWAGSSPGGLAVMEGQSCSLHIGWRRKRVLIPVNLGLGWMTQWTRMFQPGCLPSTTHEERLSEFLLHTCSSNYWIKTKCLWQPQLKHNNQVSSVRPHDYHPAWQDPRLHLHGGGGGQHQKGGEWVQLWGSWYSEGSTRIVNSALLKQKSRWWLPHTGQHDS